MGSSHSRSRPSDARRRVRHTNSAPPSSRLPRRDSSIRTRNTSPRSREHFSLSRQSPKSEALTYRRFSSAPESTSLPLNTYRVPRVLPATPTATPRTNHRPPIRTESGFPKILIRRDTFGNPPEMVVGGAKFRPYDF